MSIQVKKKDQKILLNYLIDIPPLEYQKECDTEDRIQHWFDCKVFYSCLRSFLKSHFQGLPLPTESLDLAGMGTEVTLLDKDLLLQRVGLEMDYYLNYYSVISWGWKYIAPTLQKTREKTGNKNIPETPGQALVAVIEGHFHGLFLVLFPEKVTGNYYKEYSPRKAYKRHLDCDKLSSLKNNSEPLTALQKQKVAALDQQIEKERKLLQPFTGLQEFYLSLCLPHAKWDQVLKRRLDDLQKITKLISDERKRNLHPLKKRQAYAVNRGNFQKLT